MYSHQLGNNPKSKSKKGNEDTIVAPYSGAL